MGMTLNVTAQLLTKMKIFIHGNIVSFLFKVPFIWSLKKNYEKYWYLQSYQGLMAAGSENYKQCKNPLKLSSLRHVELLGYLHLARFPDK